MKPVTGCSHPAMHAVMILAAERSMMTRGTVTAVVFTLIVMPTELASVTRTGEAATQTATARPTLVIVTQGVWITTHALAQTQMSVLPVTSTQSSAFMNTTTQERHSVSVKLASRQLIARSTSVHAQPCVTSALLQLPAMLMVACTELTSTHRPTNVTALPISPYRTAHVLFTSALAVLLTVLAAAMPAIAVNAFHTQP